LKIENATINYQDFTNKKLITSGFTGQQ
jgi:hypothetical protein